MWEDSSQPVLTSVHNISQSQNPPSTPSEIKGKQSQIKVSALLGITKNTKGRTVQWEVYIVVTLFYVQTIKHLIFVCCIRV